MFQQFVECTQAKIIEFGYKSFHDLIHKYYKYVNADNTIVMVVTFNDAEGFAPYTFYDKIASDEIKIDAIEFRKLSGKPANYTKDNSKGVTD